MDELAILVMGQRKRSTETRWITATVALLATVVFVVSGVQIVPSIVPGIHEHPPIASTQLTAFLLNIALLLFAYRRSKELSASFAANDEADEKIRRLAYFDEVTGLMNRRYLIEVLNRIDPKSRASRVLMLIDLDEFKNINDVHGHPTGDEVLKVVGQRIQQVAGEGAQCVRLGGDEFAVLVKEDEAEQRPPEQLAASLIASINEVIRTPSTFAEIGASVGLARLEDDGNEVTNSIRRADIALYEAKRLGKNRWVAFEPAMETRLRERSTLEDEIRKGIGAGQFVPFFQPMIDLKSGQVRGFEVLARWKHPMRGLLEPYAFLALAESTGLIGDLSFSVMTQALRIASNWSHDLKISVNVSTEQFKDALLAERILHALATTGFPPARLEVEIHEGCLAEDYDRARSIIQSLKNSGIAIVVDDLGTSYTSITRLRDLPFDRIKLDRIFMDSFCDPKNGSALVKAIATLGKELSVPVSAEGVETKEVQARLVELGCLDAQGWLFGRALSAEETILGFGRPLPADGASDVPRAANS